jgi:hypothetical protein
VEKRKVVEISKIHQQVLIKVITQFYCTARFLKIVSNIMVFSFFVALAPEIKKKEALTDFENMLTEHGCILDFSMTTMMHKVIYDLCPSIKNIVVIDWAEPTAMPKSNAS